MNNIFNAAGIGDCRADRHLSLTSRLDAPRLSNDVVLQAAMSHTGALSHVLSVSPDRCSGMLRSDFAMMLIVDDGTKWLRPCSGWRFHRITPLGYRSQIAALLTSPHSDPGDCFWRLGNHMRGLDLWPAASQRARRRGCQQR